MKILGREVVPFGHLHTHTEYSLKDSPLRVNEAVDEALELGMNFLAITEHGNMHSVYKFYNACMETGKRLVDIVGEELKIEKDVLKDIKKLMPKGKNMKLSLRDVAELKSYEKDYKDLFNEVMNREVKPILGVEAYTIPNKEICESKDKKVSSLRNHLVLLAKDEIGYRQLIKAVSKSYLFQHRTSQSVFPRMHYDLMKELFVGGHIVALSSCIQGEIPTHLLDNDYEGAKEKALFFESIFGKGNFYLELQNHGLEDEEKVLPQLIELSKDTSIPLVATNDVHYANKEDARVRDILTALRVRSVVDEIDKDCEELYMKSYEEMLDLFKSTPQAIHNTVKIANMCNVEFKKEERFPHFDVPIDMSEAEYLVHLSKEGIYKRFPDFDTMDKKSKEIILNRMNRELDTINKLQYAGYLLIVQDFIQEGKRRGLVGPGRGSAVGSLVCYLIGITDVDPLKHDLIFERFLNEDRVSFPDIDTDFDCNRDDVIDYVKRKYGEHSVCSIVTFGTFGARASIRNAGRATGKNLSLCDKIAKMIPARPGVTLKTALDENPKLKEEYEKKRDVKSLIDDAFSLEGLASHTSIHAAGIIIADKDISNYIPLIYDEVEGLWVAQFDMTECEADAKLLKMDFLGLNNLTIIGGAFRDIEKNHGKKITLADIDINKEEEVSEVINEIFCKGKTKAIFQFESSGMVSLLKRFRPSSIEDLILLNAAYRPGPMQYIDELIKVKHKRKRATYINPQMENILNRTYGRPIYQEQIMKIFNEVAGFTLGESDIIRRAMAKQKAKELEEYLPKFKEELIKKGTSNNDVEKFSQELIEFSNYAFNKSHSAAYAYIAYYTAWLKCYYPEEYMANVLNYSSLEDLPVYIKESRDMGIEILPPSVNESGLFFTAVEKGVIRFGLGGIKNVGKASKDIINERETNGEFVDIKDFVQRMLSLKSRATHKQVFEGLIYAGSLDCFELNRHKLQDCGLEYVSLLKEYLKKKDTAKRQDTIDRAKKKVDEFIFDPFINEYSKDFILEREKDYLGFYASGHPLDDYEKIIEKNADAMLGEFGLYDNKRDVTVVGQIHSFMPLFTKANGTAMGKFVLEDLTGEVDCIAFPKAFESCEKNILEDTVVIIKGQVMVEVEDDNVDIQISINEIIPITSTKKMYIRINNIFDWERKAKGLVNQYSGSDSLFVYFEDDKELKEAKIKVKACKELESNLIKHLGEKNCVIIQGA